MAVETMAQPSLDINVHHITRLEGHGNLVINVQDGTVEEAHFHIIEAPRLFEVMVKGHSYEELHHMTSRICGICAVSHTSASLQATERALGIEISEQTRLLRLLAFHGEMASSHVLHVYFLAAPDLLGTPSVVPLVQTHPDVVRRAMRLKKLFYDQCAVVLGRHTHPVAMEPGGFSHFPTEKELVALKERLIAARADLEATVELCQQLPLPDFARETEYVSLTDPHRYAFYEGDIKSSEGCVVPPEEYRAVTNEYVVPHSTAKHARWHRDAYAVGALARFNNNHPQLHPKAREAAQALGLTAPCTNPFMNNVAQVVETVHCIEDSIALIDTLLDKGVKPEKPVPPARLEGDGVGAVEAPRGILFHHYVYEKGHCVKANCIIPTAQNLGNIDRDLRAFTPQLMATYYPDKETIRHKLEMLIRSYDPCISCSVHLLEVEFKEGH
ncbi:MAG: Ni/Fe hydrogenase subunit alpha [Abditibacteriales bacterium]|nr:Ni/Fe hydrogenase subunit alpha [Abditibacteriales bacterium]MDW8367140.1 Ni/Fe hydrogenase subunit alpha [Abditibacteriales bacterium]